MTISAEQRAWLKDLGALVGEPAPVDDNESDDSARSAPAKRRRLPKLSLVDLPTLGEEAGGKDAETGDDDAGQRFGFGPEDILPVIPGLIDEATQRRATGAIHNNTQQVLRLDTASLDEIDDESGKTPGILHGKYVAFPPSQIAANDQSGRFVAENNKVLIFSTTGAEGFVKYILDPQGTAWIVHFNNPFGATGEKNSADARVEGPNAAQFETPKPGMSGKSDVKYLFILNAKGGTGPPPPPSPAPGPDVRSSCLLTITNNTKVPLTFLDSKHERGNFLNLVPTTVPAGTSITVASVETPNSKEQGSKGFIIWQVGSTPQDPVWFMEWDNPEGQTNTSSADVTPPAIFRSVDQIGQGDENVPASFTISGGGDAPPPVPPPAPPPVPVPPPPPVPVPPPPPGVDVPFEPPVESKQPTLRKGDKGQDQWVEYAQRALNFHVKAGLPVDGDFTSATEAAVLKFQKQKGLMVDGVIGNQTWAALREGVPENPGTDGREPHTFTEQGVEARWSLESPRNNIYEADKDTFFLQLVQVGDTPLDPATIATVKITPPGATSSTRQFSIGAPVKTDPPARHDVVIPRFRAQFPSVPVNAPVTEYFVDAFLPKELGGDLYSAKVRE